MDFFIEIEINKDKALKILDFITDEEINTLRGPIQHSLLTFACKFGYYDINKKLIDRGANVLYLNSLKNGPLFYACQIADDKTIKLLLNNGAKKHINLTNKSGKNPLITVMLQDDGIEGAINVKESFKILLENGADMNKIVYLPTSSNTLTPLQYINSNKRLVWNRSSIEVAKLKKNLRKIYKNFIIKKTCTNIGNEIKNIVLKKEYQPKMIIKCKDFIINNLCNKPIATSIGNKKLEIDINISPLLSLYLTHKSNEDFKYTNRFTFKNQHGIDEGGLTKIFWNMVTKEILKLKLFLPNGELNPQFKNYNYINGLNDKVDLSKKPKYIPTNRFSEYNFYNFIGKIIAKSIIVKQPLGILLSYNILYRFKFSKISPFTYATILYYQDFETFKNLFGVTMDQVKYLSYDFNHPIDLKKPPLKKNGGDVTKNNYSEYVKLFIKYKLDKGELYKGQKFIGDYEYKLIGLVNGFKEIIPITTNIGNLAELQKKIKGQPITNVLINKLQNLLKSKYPNPNLQQKWFIEMFTEDFKKFDKNFTIEDFKNFQSKLIEFITGTTNIDFNKGLNIKVYNNLSTNSLPTTHTCFNTIDLPPYETKTKMYNKIKIAVLNFEKGTSFAGGKCKKCKKKKKSKRKINKSGKKIRKHSGINKTTGKLKKGYKYSGKRLKSGLREIIKRK